jgi:hypothetical protein
MAIAADSAGNSYVTGDFNGSALFGSITLNSAGTRDVFVAKYRVDGTVAWAKRFGGPYDDLGESIAIDGSGNVVVTGRFQGTADLGAGMTSSGGYDIFLAKYAGTDGRLLWSKKIGGTGSDEGAAVALDGSGNIFLTGQFFGSVDFGGGAATNASSYVQAFLAKYSADGAFVWANRYGKLLATAPATSGSGRSVTVDPYDNVIMAGNYYGAVDFGSGPLSVFGGTDVFVGKYSGADGRCLWSKGFGDPSDQHAASVTSDAAGNVILTGDFLNSITFGGAVLPSSGTAQTIFLAKFYPDGLHQWSQSFVAGNFTAGSFSYSVTVDNTNNIYLTGQMMGLVNLGGGQLYNAAECSPRSTARRAATSGQRTSGAAGARGGASRSIRTTTSS